ncbi:hypothetical protein AYI68_g4940, partial [Smittium mucronatum]
MPGWGLSVGGLNPFPVGTQP